MAQSQKRIEQLAPELERIISLSEPIQDLADGFGGPQGPAEGPLWWREGGHLVFKPIGGAVGTLPIHPWILEKTGIFDRYYSKLFGNLGQEKQMLDSLASVSVTPKQVVLKYQPH